MLGVNASLECFLGCSQKRYMVSIEPELTCSVGLVGQQTAVLELHTCVSTFGILCGCWGWELRSSSLPGKALYCLNHSLALQIDRLFACCAYQLEMLAFVNLGTHFFPLMQALRWRVFSVRLPSQFPQAQPWSSLQRGSWRFSVSAAARMECGGGLQPDFSTGLFVFSH